MAGKVTVLANGPYLIDGEVEIIDSQGNLITSSGKAALCRCGASAKKPFCDGTHRKIDFKDPGTKAEGGE